MGFFPHLPDREQDVIADVGCGPIPFFCDYAIKAKRQIAVDPLYEQYLKLSYYQKFCDCVVTWIRSTVALETGVCDSVFALNMLDHVQSPNDTIDELIRILKPGGCLYLFVDLEKDPDHMHPHMISEQWLRSALAMLDTVQVHIEKSWKFGNNAMWYVGQKGEP